MNTNSLDSATITLNVTTEFVACRRVGELVGALVGEIEGDAVGLSVRQRLETYKRKYEMSHV